MTHKNNKIINNNLYKRIISLILVLGMIFSQNLLGAFSVFGDDETERNTGSIRAVEKPTPHGGYGITNLHVEDFKYFEEQDRYQGSNGAYHWWGTGIKFDFAIPAEAEKGDYFTLKLPDELIIANIPMYNDSETVPYAKLDNQPNRYKFYTDRVKNKARAQTDNIWFKVREEGSNGDEKVLLNAYYTKNGEVTFVVQEYAAKQNAPIKGSGILGAEMTAIDRKYLQAYTDIRGRHYKGNYKAAIGGSLKSEDEIRVGDEFPVGNPNNPENVDGILLTGILPDKELLSVSEGARLVNGLSEAVEKDVIFKTRYMGFKEHSISAVARINYKTELYKGWFSGNIRYSHGQITVQPIKEDRDWLYFGLSYNAAANNRYNSWLQLPTLIVIGGRNSSMWGIDLPESKFPKNVQYLEIDNTSYTVYKGQKGRNPQSFIEHNNDPIRIGGRSEGWVDTQKTPWMTMELEKQQNNLPSSLRPIINIKDTSQPFYMTFRAKIAHVNHEGIPLIMTDTNDAYRKTQTDAYARTYGLADGEILPKPPEYIVTPALKIIKVNEDLDTIKKMAGQVTFKVTDETEGYEWTQSIDDEGQLTFQSLLNGHSYILEETEAKGNFKKSDQKYRVTVNNEGKVKITTLEGEEINSRTRPLFFTGEEATFKFKNGPRFSFKIRKLDSSGKTVTGSNAKFELYKPDDYTIVDGQVQQATGAVPKEMNTNINNRFGYSKELGIETTKENKKYALVEKEAPNGTSILKNPIFFSVDENGVITIDNNNAGKVVVTKDGDLSILEITNETVARVIIDKFDKKTQDKMQGVKFELLDGNKQSLAPKVEQTTDANGQAVFNGLKKGTYYIKETETLEGYVLPTNEFYKVVVSEDLTTTTTQERSAVDPELITTVTKEILEEPSAVMARYIRTPEMMFRSMNFEDRSADTPNPLYQNVGANTFDSVTANQTIEPTDTQGRYKVNVNLNGINNAGSYYIFAIEQSYWVDKSRNYRDVLQDAFYKIKSKDPNARVAVIVDYNDGGYSVGQRADVIIDARVDQAIANINKIQTSYYKWNSAGNRDFNGLVEKAQELFNNENYNFRNKILIQFLSTGIGNSEAGKINDQIFPSGKLMSSNQVEHTVIYNGSYTNPVKSGDTATHYYWAKEGVAISDGAQWGANVKQKISSIIGATRIGPGEINIHLDSSVAKFDGFNDSTANATQSNGNITVTDISSKPKDATSNYTFSYFIRSNPNAELDVLKEIATNSTYSLYKDKLPGLTMNIPKPKLAMPSITVSADRTYTNIVPNEYKKQTNINIEATANKNGIDTAKLSDTKALNTDKVTFKKLPKFDINGNNVTYQITETGLADILSSTINPNQVVGADTDVHITTNLRNLNIKVTKSGNDVASLKKVKLIGFSNNTEVDLGDLGVDTIKDFGNGTEVTFENLPRLANDGSVITYSVVGLDENEQKLDSEKYRVEYTYGKDQNGIDDSYTIINHKYPIIPIGNSKNLKKYKLHIKKRLFDEVNKVGENVHDSSQYDAVNSIITGARFKLEKKNGSTWDVIFNKKAVNDNGYILQENLTEGTYKLTELELDGYFPINPIEFEINENTAKNDDSVRIFFHNDNKTDLVAIVKNKPKPKDIKIVKVDSDDTDTKLSGAEFEIYNSNGDSLGPLTQPSSTTNNNGETNIFNNQNNGSIGYAEGLYFIKEKTAPTGYKILKKEIPFYITTDKEIIIPAKKVNNLWVKDNDTEYGVTIATKVDDNYPWKADKTLNVITIGNKKVNAVYPSTGGIGSFIYYTLGVSLMGYVVIRYRRRILRE